MTFALFTDERAVTHHLQAGTLEITLKRVNLDKTTLTSDGYLETKNQPGEITFDDNTKGNVFGIIDGEKIVPGCKYVATMQLENHSDVAFSYWIEIDCDDGSNEYLAKQLKVTVSTDTDSSALVGDGLTVPSDGSFVGDVAIGAKANFVVTVEFLDSFVKENNMGYYDNDLAQGKNLSFDLIVHAVQATKAP